MKLHAHKYLDVKKTGDVDEGISAGISLESLPFLFELVSKNLYSNPIGSIVREITSNGFDAHIEAGVDDPVVISRDYHTDEGWTIEFKDVGVGLSPERITKIYMNYFSSTKRETNEQHGGFGIGSKTPLAYSDIFYMTTVHNGMEYDCIVHKGEAKPTLESLYGWDEVEEPIVVPEGVTLAQVLSQLPLDKVIEKEDGWYLKVKYPAGIESTERNGTVIRIPVEKNDLDKFKNEIKYQLSYFDNVYFAEWGISNDYDIYVGQNFKFRSDIPQHDTDLHICIGKARYPIDFEKVKLPASQKKMPVALIFNIGELPITPNREALRYDDTVVKLIQDKAKGAFDELIGMFEAQNPNAETLEEYTNLTKVEPSVAFDDAGRHKLHLWASSGLSKNIKFGPISHLKTKLTPHNLFFMWTMVGTITNGKMEYNKSYVYRVIDHDDVIKNKCVIFPKGSPISLYTDAYIQSLYPGKTILLIRKKDDVKGNYKNAMIGLGVKESKELGKAKMVIEYSKVIDGYLKTKFGTYADLKPTETWIADYRRSIKESSAAWIRKMKAKAFVRDAMYSFKGMEYSTYELQNRKGVMVYGYKDDKDELTQIYNVVRQNLATSKAILTTPKKSEWERNVKFGHFFRVLQVAKSTEQEILGAKKTVYYTLFYTTKFFKKIVTARYILKTMQEMDIDNVALRMGFVKGYQEVYDRLDALVNKYFRSKDIHKYNWLDTYSTPAFFIPEMIKELEHFKSLNYKIPLLRCLSTQVVNKTEDTKESFADYLKSLKIRLKNNYYLRPVMETKAAIASDEEDY